MSELNNHQTPNHSQNGSKWIAIDDQHRRAIGYLAVLRIAQDYAYTSERELCQEIGMICADLLEPEFARLDRRNLIERKKMLEEDLYNIRKIHKLDDYEQQFISNGKETAELLGLDANALKAIGVPIKTLKAAEII